MPKFETFKKSSLLAVSQPHLTIQKRGTITLDAAAYNALGAPAAVELLFDPAEKVLGLRPVPVQVQHAAFVRPTNHKSSGPWVVSAMAFVHHYQIDTTQSRRWIATVEDGALCIRLDDPAKIVSKDRRPRDAGGKLSTAHRPRPYPGNGPGVGRRQR